MKKGREISEEAMRLRIADLCARSEQCEFDLRRKMASAGMSAAQASEIIRFLREQKFIDDQRYAGAFARDKARFSGWGRNKIRMALLAKRIPESAIRNALESIDQQIYLLTMRRLGEAKAAKLNLNIASDRAKFLRYLLSRGYESSLACHLLEAIRKS